jgi:metacaspase-1
MPKPRLPPLGPRPSQNHHQQPGAAAWQPAFPVPVEQYAYPPQGLQHPQQQQHDGGSGVGYLYPPEYAQPYAQQPYQPQSYQPQPYRPPLPPPGTMASYPTGAAPQNLQPPYPAGAAPQVAPPVMYNSPPHVQPAGYGQAPQPQFPSSAPGAGYVQPANAPPAVYGAAAGRNEPSQFRPTGRKKALLIGINYTGRQQLQGCVNDVKCMQYLLATRFGFGPENTTVMTDKPCGIAGVTTMPPTRRNILSGMRQLVAGSQPGDSLFFHFSGHGGQVRDVSGDEDDGYDETLIPMDWQKAGQIVDDEIYDVLVRHLPGGVRLTAVLDACHSGTALDLPYLHDVRFTGSGMTVAGESGGRASLGSGLAQVAGALVQGRPSSAVGPILKMVTGQVKKKRRQGKSATGPDWSKGEVLMFAGCTDKQTSADTNKLSGGRTVTGAMTYALIEAVEHSTVGDWHNYSYQKLLHTMRQKLLAARMTQTPQFSTSHPFDMNNKFVI